MTSLRTQHKKNIPRKGIPCFAYTRVSTTKQRDHSVSLEAQRDAIERYARQNGLTVTRWFSESQTAAKRGRAEFAKMLRLLKQGKAEGVIVHKIDRSARNLRDWADFAELADRGIAVHFAAEALDLASRGGRLSADIQAVVSADYVRNLRQEAKKGIRGRYQQGLLPGRAPVGYLNNGGGKPKTIDPVQGPLVREAFEHYATGYYSLVSLLRTMTERGLKNTKGRPLDKNGISRVLTNPFYAGVIRVKKTGEVFPGQHKALIKRSLFDAVQVVMSGKGHVKKHRHTFVFRRLLRCALCEKTLVAERQKGHVYYRCHTKDCEVRCIREEAVSDAVEAALERITLTEEELSGMKRSFELLLEKEGTYAESREDALVLEIGSAETRLARLTDLLIDGVLDEESFRVKKRELTERRERLLEEQTDMLENPSRFEAMVREYLELASTALVSYERANEAEKRVLVENITSNRTVSPENVAVELQMPFRILSNRGGGPNGAPYRDVPRTGSLVSTPESGLLASSLCIVERLWEWVKRSDVAGSDKNPPPLPSLN